MKTKRRQQGNRGLTFVEVVVLIFTLFVLTALLIPALAVSSVKHGRLGCTNNLKQMGLGFRIWEGDKGDKYPMAVANTNGGAMESLAAGNVTAVFQVMSNELSTPKILACPNDLFHRAAPDFQHLTAKNVSYFLNSAASEANPEDWLCGDDNFEIGHLRVKSGLLEITSNTPVAWTLDRHKYSGNIALADGSVISMGNYGLTDWRHSADFTPLRLVVP